MEESLPADEPLAPRNRSSRLGLHCCWRLLILVNIALVAALSGVAYVLYAEVQSLEQRIAKDEVTVDQLQQQMESQGDQQGEIQQLNRQVADEHNLTVATLAGVFTLLTCLLGIFHIFTHIQNYHEPSVQRKIVAILWMSPIYSVTSFLSLIFPPAQDYVSIIKDFYESYVIYTFLSFLIAVLGRNGGREEVVSLLAKHAPSLKNPTRCLRSWYHPPPEVSDEAKANAVLTECQILAMQFVFLRPLTSLANFAIEMVASSRHPPTDASENLFSNSSAFNGTSNETYVPPSSDLIDGDNATRFLMDSNISSVDDLPSNNETGPALFFGAEEGGLDSADRTYLGASFGVAMVTNVSVFFAFAGLLKFYHAVHNDLAWCKPWPKFLSIKAVVFLTFWQGLAISIAVHVRNSEDNAEDSTDRAAEIQNILICIEMLFFSVTHFFVFPAEEWAPDYEPRRQHNHKPGLGFGDFVKDVSTLVQGRRKRALHMRARKMEGSTYMQPESAGDRSDAYVDDMAVSETIDDDEDTYDLSDYYHDESQAPATSSGAVDRTTISIEMPEIQ